MTTICYAIDDIVCDGFNTWFSLCCSSIDELRKAQPLDNIIKKDGRVYHAR
ncbi:hypothetical protein NC652_003997 [Populus alba x Populus x berolinensis]|nr:hypothetical protein NC652_003997 [Populus alba x Populus x berolinensis]KAJ7014577.1 hypothetical protein NC653_004016 [Populus alba x Populus x berolinensis]